MSPGSTSDSNDGGSRHSRLDALVREEDGHSLPDDYDGAASNSEERSLTLQVIEGTGERDATNIPSLTCAFLAALTTGGTTYAFGLYGAALKSQLHLTQSQLDTIGSATFCAGLFSWVPGMIVDKFGTKVGLVAGGIQGSVSLSLYWCVATQFFPVERALLVPTLSMLGVTIFLSCALITGSVFKIIVSTCGPGSKGTAVGAAKGYVGLGAGVYACMFNSIRSKGQSDLDFLPMAAFFFFACVTIPSFCLMPSNKTVQETVLHDESTPFHFRSLYCSLIAMATLIIVNSLRELYDDDETTETTADDKHDGPNIPMALFLVTIWVGPILSLQLLPKKSTLAGPVQEHEEEEGEGLLVNDEVGTEILQDAEIIQDSGEISMQRMRKSASSVSNGSASRGLSSMAVGVDEGIPDFLRLPDGREEQNNLDRSMDNANFSLEEEEVDDDDDNKNLWQMLQTPTAQLMLVTTTILVGGGIVETNNMGQMVEALHFPADTTSASLAFFSVAQSAGRVVTGALSESALNWPTKKFCIEKGIPRTFFLVTAAMTGFVAHLLLAGATSKGIFVVGATLAGFAFGMVWPLLVLIVGEVFGTKNVGANYMFFDGFTSAAGSLLLAKFVAQEVYEDHIDKKDDPDNTTCLGTGCFSMTHAVVAVLSFLCIFTSLCLVFTTRHVYNKRSLHKGN